MCLIEKEVNSIKRNADKYFGNGTKVILFGSRVFNDKRGGDIDVLIEPSFFDVDLYEKKLHFVSAVKQELGDQKLDVIIKRQRVDNRAIIIQAQKTGIVL